MPIDYTGFAFGKEPRRGKPQVQGLRPTSPKQRQALVANRPNKVTVHERQQGTCFAVLVSPVCTVRIDHVHEVVPVGVGGERVTANQVGVCGACHRAAQGSVGGNPLVFDWPGKDDGAAPNADVLGGVTCRWKGAT